MQKEHCFNKIYKKDVFVFLKSLQDSSIDLAIVDPPYNLKKAHWDTFKTQDEFLFFTFKWIDLMLLKLKKTASFYIFNTPYNCALMLCYLQNKAVFQNWITWYKKDGMSAIKKKYNNNQESILFYTMDKKNYFFDSEIIRIPYNSTQRIECAKTKGIIKNGKRWFPNPNGKLCPDVWEIVSQRHKEKVSGKTQKLNHPTPKPQEMIERMIKASSKDGDLVLDLFSGTGITSKCALKLNRNFIGCDKYFIQEN